MRKRQLQPTPSATAGRRIRAVRRPWFFMICTDTDAPPAKGAAPRKVTSPMPQICSTRKRARFMASPSGSASTRGASHLASLQVLGVAAALSSPPPPAPLGSATRASVWTVWLLKTSATVSALPSALFTWRLMTTARRDVPPSVKKLSSVDSSLGSLSSISAQIRWMVFSACVRPMTTARPTPAPTLSGDGRRPASILPFLLSGNSAMEMMCEGTM
mmetsp:Transcript_65554/g.168725  ORF Transcript_65554/g.168725 Transcript_65554/m.168725 type:complete len:216 (+) Transcript_65554:1885-2532(+)